MVPGITNLFVKKLHGTVFEIYTRNAITYRCNIICSIDEH